MLRRWAESIGQSLLFLVLIALVPSGVVTYLARIQSVWTYPVLTGLAAGAAFSVAILAILAIQRLPPKRVIPTFDNIENCVRTWLDHFHVGVKNDPDSGCYFRLFITADSSTKMFVGRPKGEYSDYVFCTADVVTTDEQRATLAEISEHDREHILLKIRLELARRNVGYSSTEDKVHIFKRIPVSESLTGDRFFAALDEVEAAVHAVIAVLFLELQEFQKREAKAAAQLSK